MIRSTPRAARRDAKRILVARRRLADAEDADQRVELVSNSRCRARRRGGQAVAGEARQVLFRPSACATSSGSPSWRA